MGMGLLDMTDLHGLRMTVHLDRVCGQNRLCCRAVPVLVISGVGLACFDMIKANICCVCIFGQLCTDSGLVLGSDCGFRDTFIGPLRGSVRRISFGAVLLGRVWGFGVLRSGVCSVLFPGSGCWAFGLLGSIVRTICCV